MNLIKTIIEKQNTIPPNNLTTFLNPYSYLIARKNPEILDEIGRIHIDGSLLCLLLRLSGVKLERVSFDMTALAPVVFEKSSIENLSIYFIGGAPGVAIKAIKIIRESYPDIKIAGSRHGFFSSQIEKENAINNILNCKADIVIASMGTPYQERFLIDLKKSGWNGYGYTCGGFFHQTAKQGIKYYPATINKLNLRWLYRIFDEPALAKRYFTAYPIAVIKILFDIANNAKSQAGAS